MTNEERRSVSDLMLMCYPHHRETNNVAKYTVADLKRMKAAHERRFSRPDRAMREKVARLHWAELVGAGVVAGASLGGIVQQIRSALDPPVRPSEQPRETLPKELELGLRYTPTAKVYCFSRDPLHLSVGDLFIEIFKSVGWLVESMDKPPRFQNGEEPDFDHSMLMMFEFKNLHQLPIGRQAIDELFRKCGFVSGSDEGETVRRQGDGLIRFYTPMVVRGR